MLNNNSVDFLMSLGWDININKKDNKICKTPYEVLEEIEDVIWYSIEEALEIESLDHPEEYEEYIILGNLYSSKYIGKCGSEDY